MITILGDREVRQTGRVRNASGSGLGLLVPEPIAPGTALRLEVDDDLLLGEVMYCRPQKDGCFVGVQLEQILRGLSGLRNQFRDFCDTPDAARK